MSGALSWVNWALGSSGATIGASGTFTSQAINASYPAANVISPDPSLVTRVDYVTSGSATSLFRVNWSTNQPTRVVALLNCRISFSDVSTIAVYVDNAGGSTQENLGSYTSATIMPIPGTTDRYDLFFITSEERSAGQITLGVSVGASKSGYYEVGHVWAGDGLVYANGLGAEWAAGVDDQSVVEIQPSGGFAAYAYNTLDVLEVSKRGLSQQDAIGSPSTVNSLRHMLRIAGFHAPVVVISSTADMTRAQAKSVYGLIRDAQGIASLGRGDLYGTAMRVRQIR